MMFLSSFTLPHPRAQVNSRCLKQQIILTSGTTSLFSLSPCPTSEAMSLKNAELLKQNNLLLILLLVPRSARRVRKIFNLYIQRWRPFTLIFVSCRRFFCLFTPNLTIGTTFFPFLCSRFKSSSLGAIPYKGDFKRIVDVYSLSA
jgi:hypothetical protein